MNQLNRTIIPLAIVLTCLPVSAIAEQAEPSGAEEVPAVSTTGEGEFRIRLGDDRARFTLQYENLEGAVTQAHIHFAQEGVNGGVAVFLCTNLGNGPAGTQGCPPAPATIRGVITADSVVGPADQGISPDELGKFEELMEAIDDGHTYVNIHTEFRGSGEIRGQID